MQPSQPPGTLVLHTRSARKLLPRQLRTLVATINGHRVALAWGVNYVPFPPGMHQVTVHNRFTRAPGPTIFIDNRHTPAQPVYYAEAWWYGQSALGHQPLECPGQLVAVLTLLWNVPFPVVLSLFFLDGFGWLRWLPLAATPLIALHVVWVIVASRRDHARIPAPATPPPHPPGVFVVRTSYPALVFDYLRRKLRATICGREFPLAWGENHLPLPPPGVHLLKVEVETDRSLFFPASWTGVAEMPIDTRSGPPLPIYYAAPYITGFGAISHGPVESPGKTDLIVLLAPFLGLFVIFSLLALYGFALT